MKTRSTSFRGFQWSLCFWSLCFWLLCFWLALLLLAAHWAAAGTESVVPGHAEAQEILIGVRAHRGTAKAMRRWQTTADYLAEQIPGYRFQMIPFENNSALNQAVSRGEFHFVLTNPASHVEQEIRYGVSALATLINKRQGNGYTRFGSVIFTRANRIDINQLKDLKGKSFMGVDELGFGGWRVAWRELQRNDIDPYRDFEPLMFAGGIQQNVVFAVLDGKADAGSVRTDMLELMAEKGEIDLQDLKAVQSRHTRDFPFIHSTKLYPEWPFAKLAHTDDALAEQVAKALLAITADHPAANAGKYLGWHTVLNYQPVNNLLKELGVGPYERHGAISISEVLIQYRDWLIGAVLLMILGSVIFVRISILNKQLKSTERQLTAANASLRNMTLVDGLTGTGNRRKLNQYLDQQWGQACRDGTPTTAIILDIDHFKEYNDTYGHQAGDDCLREVAKTLDALFRRAGDLVVRYGGEEFLIVLKGRSREEVAADARRLRQGIQMLKIEHRGSKISNYLTASLGVETQVPGKDEKADELIAAADRALYQAKQQGRNCVVIADC